MKPIETYRRCEYCDKLIKEESDENYENNIIEIKDGFLFLDSKTIKRNHQEGITDAHIKDLNGVYCNYICLTKRIENILNINDQ